MRIYEAIMHGGPVMWPLLACSLVAVTVTAERLIFWVRLWRRGDSALRAKVLRATEGGDW